MTYSKAPIVSQAREGLGKALAALQEEKGLPDDVMAVAQNIAAAVGELFEAEKAESEGQGREKVDGALGHLSQTMALLQDVREGHAGVVTATDTIAESMGLLYPLTTEGSMRPSTKAAGEGNASAEAANTKGTAADEAAPATNADISSGTKESANLDLPVVTLEGNIGATTQSNFFVGFSGEVSEGGVFVATYETYPIGSPVDLHITLPGGFEFRTKGTISFTREIVEGDVVPPGLGIRFTALDKASRDLVLRFVRKRPPLFFE